MSAYHDTPLTFCFMFTVEICFIDGDLIACVPVAIFMCVCVIVAITTDVSYHGSKNGN
jgi:hypothetical protein